MTDTTVVPEAKLNPNSAVQVPSSMVPSFRTQLAIDRGVERNILLVTWGGLGDQICAEPTLRWALNTFKGCEISLASECPELFAHLAFKDVFDTRRVRPVEENYLAFNTILPPSHLQWEFMSHMLVNCVDYPSLCAFRCQLPVASREVRLVPNQRQFQMVADFLRIEERVPTKQVKAVAVHAGRHWQSKTFPADWWNSVIRGILSRGAKPVLIGADTDDNRGTVDVDATGCIDLRGRLSVMESVALLQSVRVLLTNDSAPLHMAASGTAHIGYVATCKHPDYLTHWRNGQFGWRMKNFGKGGIWDVLDYCPNKENAITAENVGDELLRSWLPEPDDMAEWAVERFDEP